MRYALRRSRKNTAKHCCYSNPANSNCRSGESLETIRKIVGIIENVSDQRRFLFLLFTAVFPFFPHF